MVEIRNTKSRSYRTSFLRQLGKNDSKVTYKESEPFTTKIKTPDATRAKRDLGFELKVPTEEGIAKTIEWFRRLPD